MSCCKSAHVLLHQELSCDMSTFAYVLLHKCVCPVDIFFKYCRVSCCKIAHVLLHNNNFMCCLSDSCQIVSLMIAEWSFVKRAHLVVVHIIVVSAHLRMSCCTHSRVLFYCCICTFCNNHVSCLMNSYVLLHIRICPVVTQKTYVLL